jgi:PPOX class probable F420-dependent enzyme
VPFDPENGEHRAAIARLETKLAIWFTTVNPGGQPQTRPVWFVWQDETVLVYSRLEARRNANIAANPRVSLHLNHDGTGSDVVAFEGVATVDVGAPPAHDNAAYMLKYGDFIVSMPREEFSRRFGVPIRVRPTRVKVFNA